MVPASRYFGGDNIEPIKDKVAVGLDVGTTRSTLALFYNQEIYPFEHHPHRPSFHFQLFKVFPSTASLYISFTNNTHVVMFQHSAYLPSKLLHSSKEGDVLIGVDAESQSDMYPPKDLIIRPKTLRGVKYETLHSFYVFYISY
jgi:molecular chaperone DnaK (HSP70)